MLAQGYVRLDRNRVAVGIAGLLVAAALLALTAALLAMPASAGAATITVDTTTFDAGASNCGLKDAIASANGNIAVDGCAQGEDSPAVDVIDFSLPNPSTITYGFPLTVTSDMMLTGPGADQLTLDASGCAGTCRALTVNSGGSTISGLTFANGVVNNDGGAISTAAGSTVTLDRVTVDGNTVNAFVAGAATCGGGISYDGTLNLNRSTVSNNTVNNTLASGTVAALGGGVCGTGTLHVDSSTINDNTAAASNGSVATQAIGGGIYSAGAATIERSTIVGNVTTATGTGPSRIGGGLETAIGSGAAALTSDTLAGNHAMTGGGPNLYIAGGSVSAANTILASPNGNGAVGAASCGLTMPTSLGFNLESGTSCGFSPALHDQPSTLPRLRALDDNGGPTQTRALSDGSVTPLSPAIEAGSSFGETIDQRGMLRPSDFLTVPTLAGGDGADIGAYEVQGQPFAGPMVAQPPPALTAPPPAAPKKKRCKKKHGKKPKRCRGKKKKKKL